MWRKTKKHLTTPTTPTILENDIGERFARNVGPIPCGWPGNSDDLEQTDGLKQANHIEKRLTQNGKCRADPWRSAWRFRRCETCGRPGPNGQSGTRTSVGCVCFCVLLPLGSLLNVFGVCKISKQMGREVLISPRTQ